jgi:predicted O-methyltransferase YrrM
MPVTQSLVSNYDYLLGVIFPMSRTHALDPFTLKNLSKTSVRRILWTAESRALQVIARATYNRNLSHIRGRPIAHIRPDRGESIADTAVTAGQMCVLLKALNESNRVEGSVAEIGSYRGVTTCALARATEKRVYAIDPFIGYGGSADDLKQFLAASGAASNISHVRKTSGAASNEFKANSLALVFIDGVHDFSNSWFDYCAWSKRIARGGYIAFHDVDDHPGATMTCRLVCNDKDFQPWGYCPNLIVFQKL